MIWLILGASATAISVFIERFLYYHRAQINSAEFLNGVRNILKRDNIIEALAICDATPGPVARLVKIAILNRERGRAGVRESLEDAGFLEVPRLEEKLNLLATIAQGWRMRLDPAQRVAHRAQITLRTRYGMRMKLAKV